MQKKKLKILLITHRDLDGVGCDILIKSVFGRENVKTFSCYYDTVNEVALKEGLEKEKEYDLIIISDISINLEVAEKFNSIKNKVILLDHHDSVMELNKYDFAKVILEENGEKTCGTKLVWNYLLDNFYDDTLDISNGDFYHINNFIENIRLYDTWEWKEKRNKYPIIMQNLYDIYEFEKFSELFIDKIKNCRGLIDKTDEFLLEIEQSRKERYFDEKINEVYTQLKWGYNVGFLKAEQYVSEVANYILDNKPELDLIVVLTSSRISFRTNKPNVDVGMLAKSFNGGGRQATAGCEYKENHMKDYIDIVFDIKKK